MLFSLHISQLAKFKKKMKKWIENITSWFTNTNTPSVISNENNDKIKKKFHGEFCWHCWHVKLSMELPMKISSVILKEINTWQWLYSTNFYLLLSIKSKLLSSLPNKKVWHPLLVSFSYQASLHQVSRLTHLCFNLISWNLFILFVIFLYI